MKELIKGFKSLSPVFLIVFYSIVFIFGIHWLVDVTIRTPRGKINNALWQYITSSDNSEFNKLVAELKDVSKNSVKSKVVRSEDWVSVGWENYILYFEYETPTGSWTTKNYGKLSSMDAVKNFLGEYAYKKCSNLEVEANLNDNKKDITTDFYYFSCDKNGNWSMKSSF